jgi:hypothetical protein
MTRPWRPLYWLLNATAMLAVSVVLYGLWLVTP